MGEHIHGVEQVTKRTVRLEVDGADSRILGGSL